jgi:hypothetical protein
VCQITEEITGNFRKPVSVVESEMAEMLTRKGDIGNRWREYFYEFLSFPPRSNSIEPLSSFPQGSIQDFLWERGCKIGLSNKLALEASLINSNLP